MLEAKIFPQEEQEEQKKPKDRANRGVLFCKGFRVPRPASLVPGPMSLVPRSAFRL